jgi:hypothetical protein
MSLDPSAVPLGPGGTLGSGGDVLRGVKVVSHYGSPEESDLLWVIFDGAGPDGTAFRLVLKCGTDPERFSWPWRLEPARGDGRSPVRVPEILDELRPLAREAVRRHLAGAAIP